MNGTSMVIAPRYNLPAGRLLATCAFRSAINGTPVEPSIFRDHGTAANATLLHLMSRDGPVRVQAAPPFCVVGERRRPACCRQPRTPHAKVDSGLPDFQSPGECLAQLCRLRRDHGLAIGLARVVGEIILVVDFSRPESRRWRYGGDNGVGHAPAAASSAISAMAVRSCVAPWVNITLKTVVG